MAKQHDQLQTEYIITIVDHMILAARMAWHEPEPGLAEFLAESNAVRSRFIAQIRQGGWLERNEDRALTVVLNECDLWAKQAPDSESISRVNRGRNAIVESLRKRVVI